jgi:Kdo2-lipid IVA lauroyltransferase/acyltransferase
MINKGFSYVGLFFLYLLSLLPFWILYLISDFIFILVYYVFGYRRKVVEENLRNSFPEKTAEERRVIERKFYRHLCDLIMETVKMFTISKKQLERRITGKDIHIAEEVLKQGRNIIGAVGHYGNWEIANLRVSYETDYPKIVVYKSLTNKVFDAAFNKMRSRFGATLVDMPNATRAMMEYRHKPAFNVLVSDQTPVKGDMNYFTEFLNQPTAVFLGIEKMAKLLNSVVIFCDIRKVKRGHYECTFVPLIDEPKLTATHEITEAHVRYLEKVIREQPEYWLWSHRRWKFKPENTNQ